MDALKVPSHKISFGGKVKFWSAVWFCAPLRTVTYLMVGDAPVNIEVGSARPRCARFRCCQSCSAAKSAIKDDDDAPRPEFLSDSVSPRGSEQSGNCQLEEAVSDRMKFSSAGTFPRCCFHQPDFNFDREHHRVSLSYQCSHTIPQAPS